MTSDASWGGVAKQKAPGYSGNGPDLHASMPDVWAADVLTLLNAIQHSGVTPHAWHVISCTTYTKAATTAACRTTGR